MDLAWIVHFITDHLFAQISILIVVRFLVYHLSYSMAEGSAKKKARTGGVHPEEGSTMEEEGPAKKKARTGGVHPASTGTACSVSPGPATIGTASAASTASAHLSVSNEHANAACAPRYTGPQVFEIPEGETMSECQYCNCDKANPKPHHTINRIADVLAQECVLCGVEVGVTICQGCLIPWLPQYEETLERPPPEFITMAPADRKWLCLECVRWGEYGINCKGLVGKDAVEKLRQIENFHGGRGVPLSYTKVRIMVRPSLHEWALPKGMARQPKCEHI